MSSADRRSINNAIWLCSIHADEIDANEKLYPTPLLHEWKCQAEATAHAEKGKRRPHSDDARNELIQALSGLPVPFTHTAINNVHEASTTRLNALDPRLVVETGYFKGKTTFTILPKERIPFKLSVPAALAKEWKEGLERLIDHGNDAKLPATGIKMTGSPVFELLNSGPEFAVQHISLMPNKKEAVLKLTFLEPETNQAKQLDDCLGFTSLGQKSLRFEGTLFSGLLTLVFNVPIFESPCDGSCSLSENFDKWAGTDVIKLPFFEKISQFFDLLKSGWDLDFRLELEGINVADGTLNMTNASDYIRWANQFINYVSFARKISKFLGTRILVTQVTEISRDNYETLEETIDTIEGKRTYYEPSSTVSTCQLIAENGASNIRRLAQAEENETSFRVQAHEGNLISIFGQEIRLPRMELRMDGVKPKILQDIDSIKDGDSILVEWTPTDNFSLSYRFMDKDEGDPPVELHES